MWALVVVAEGRNVFIQRVPRRWRTGRPPPLFSYSRRVPFGPQAEVIANCSLPKKQKSRDQSFLIIRRIPWPGPPDKFVRIIWQTFILRDCDSNHRFLSPRNPSRTIPTITVRYPSGADRANFTAEHANGHVIRSAIGAAARTRPKRPTPLFQATHHI